MTFGHPSRWSPTPQSDLEHSPLFAERGWGLESQPETESQDQPDLQTQLERADRLGHHFGDIQILSSTPTVQAQTQPQHTEEQEPESTAPEPRLSFAAGSDAPPPPGSPDSSSGSIQPRSFLQRNSLPTQQSSQPRISRHADVADELAQLLQAKEDTSEAEPQSSQADPSSSQAQTASSSQPQVVHQEQLFSSPGREPRLLVDPPLPVVVPGTPMTYSFDVGHSLYDRVSFFWRIDYDPHSSQHPGTPKSLPAGSGSQINLSWPLPGRHTVVCQVQFGQGDPTQYHFIQEVQAPAQQAQGALEFVAAPPQPDLLVGSLEAQKHLLEQQDPQGNAEQIAGLETQISHAQEKLELPEAGGPGSSRPLKATLVPTDRPAPCP